MKSSFYIPIALPTDEIEAMYFTRYWRKGKFRHSVNVYIITKEGLFHQFPLGYKLLTESEKALDEWILSRIHFHAPNVLVGIKRGRRCTKAIHDIEPLNFNIGNQS